MPPTRRGPLPWSESGRPTIISDLPSILNIPHELIPTTKDWMDEVLPLVGPFYFPPTRKGVLQRVRLELKTIFRWVHTVRDKIRGEALMTLSRRVVHLRWLQLLVSSDGPSS